ncbi:hypothetical protein AB0J55_00575 [Amycolatopsis sp. NPDC049688]|uniref:hypothetical protein n=1 Tax=Amycolatopsis sp. NPDC049688 TaxID=3154733 RepID=UPI00342C6208
MSTVTAPASEDPDRHAHSGATGRLYGFIPELSSIIVTIVPTLLLIVAISLSGDPALIRALVASGSFASLVVNMTYQFLPLVVGTTVYVMLARLTSFSRLRALFITGSVGAVVALVATPLRSIIVIVIAVLTILIVVVGVVVYREMLRRKKSDGPPEWHPDYVPARRGLKAGNVALSPIIPILTLVNQAFSANLVSGQGVVDSITSIVMDALPAEVVVVKDDNGVRRPIRSRVIQAGDQVTIIVNDQGAVQNIWNGDILRRETCIDKLDIWSRSPMSSLSRQLPKTPVCDEMIHVISADILTRK